MSRVRLLLTASISATLVFAQTRLPYTAIHDPAFIRASDATFMHDQDRLIGIAAGGVVKAYPAGILSQHGLVEDKGPDGPIAVTW